ncbi:MAG TPA: hypothetical protein VMT76_16260 [Puia sp.]|nr:hypothetical protein [Puia sp.]
MKVTYLILSLFVLIILVSISCQHQIQFPKTSGTGDTTVVTVPPPPPPPVDTGSSCSADTVYFANTILPLLNSSCATSGCHDGKSSGDAGQYTLNTYTGIMKIVKAGNPTGSKLVSIISGGQMPPKGHPAVTATQLDLIKTWISQGALNNSCTQKSCDTSNVTYSNSVVPILQTYCTGCHGGSSPSGGVDLTTYSGVSAEVSNGKLWGDISHASGYNAMPLGGSSLSSCQLSTISSWINKGAPNN